LTNSDCNEGSSILVTAAIILKENKVLLIKRAREPYQNHWCFPGGVGSLKKYSNPADAVADEVKIDLGCEFEPSFFTYSYGKFEVPTVTLFFKGSISGIVKENSKHVQESRWFELDEAVGKELGFDHKHVLERLIDTLS